MPYKCLINCFSPNLSESFLPFFSVASRVCSSGKQHWFRSGMKSLCKFLPQGLTVLIILGGHGEGSDHVWINFWLFCYFLSVCLAIVREFQFLCHLWDRGADLILGTKALGMQLLSLGHFQKNFPTICFLSSYEFGLQHHKILKHISLAFAIIHFYCDKFYDINFAILVFFKDLFVFEIQSHGKRSLWSE